MSDTDEATQAPTNVLGLNRSELDAILIEYGLLKERALRAEQEKTRADTEREAAEAEARRNSIAAVPLVTVEWERQPATRHECNISGRRYFGKGPLMNRAMNPPRKMRPGERTRMPVCDAVVLEEASFVTIVEGRELAEGLWSPDQFLPGIQDNMPRSDKEWEKLEA